MYLHNYYIIRAACNPGLANGRGTIPIRLYDGTNTYTGSMAKSTSAYVSVLKIPTGLQSSNAASGFVFGSGSDAVTENDYKLSSGIYSNNLSLSTLTSELYEFDNKYCVDYNLSLTNTSLNTLTIRELGYCQGINYGSNGSLLSSTYKSALVFRHVLPNDISLAPNETKIFKLTFMYNK